MGQNSSVNGIYKFVKSASVAALTLTILSACGGITTSDGSSSSTPSQTAEKAYNSTTMSYPEPTTLVTATATFNRYVDGSTGLATIESNLPIRYAEVHVLDSSGQIIQAGETNGSGTISLRIPRTAGNYTLRVNTRADNDQYRASVLMDPYSNAYYSLDTGFSVASADTTKAVTIASAPATNSSNLLGAAFNILDQIYVANAFLRANVYSSDCPVCVDNFVTAPKSQIYWAKGISPAVYYNQPSYAISFFVSKSGGGLYRGLYLLGGIEGDLCTDTDHFDRSVILHEYGHFLEDVLGKSSSPGGSHNGNTVIDPRLAWSEGWADFFQGAVLGRNYYRDTKRNAGCSAGNALSFSDFNLESRTGTDVPSTNEGIFREISIARTLWDLMTASSGVASPQYTQTRASDNKTDDNNSGKADIGFSLIWYNFRNLASTGNAFAFQNMGQLNQLNTTVVAANGAYSGRVSDYNGVLTYENQVSSQLHYGLKLRPQSSSACIYNFASGGPVPDDLEIYNNRYYVVYSDPNRTNDFYRYDYDGNASNGLINLRYRKATDDVTSYSPYDLDLYAYNESHTVLDFDDVASYAEGVYPEAGNNTTYTGFEQIDLRGKPAGTYMINVKVYYQGLRAKTSYYLETASGAQLCP